MHAQYGGGRGVEAKQPSWLGDVFALDNKYADPPYTPRQLKLAPKSQPKGGRTAFIDTKLIKSAPGVILDVGRDSRQRHPTVAELRRFHAAADSYIRPQAFSVRRRVLTPGLIRVASSKAELEFQVMNTMGGLKFEGFCSREQR